ncbi:MAG TPA: TerB family tellurite resistance protein [Thermoanaerobaculia bacterium]|nr:TerB family tellurite resistance protein [Thermoanaerobaculia bacterium]
MIGPEIDISEQEAVAIARGLLAVAKCDGTYDPREKSLIDGLVSMPTDRLTEIGADELARTLRGEAARLFLRSCLLVAFADRTFSAPERELIQRYAEALGVSAEELVNLTQSVKEFLLGPLSRLSNTDSVVEVSKKLAI